MTPSRRLLASTILAVGLPATGALADVTADDVWANLRAYMDAFGPEITAQTARSGDTLTVSDIALNWALPMGFGSIGLTQTGFGLTERGDGTVAIDYGERIEITMTVDIAGEGSLDAAFDVIPHGIIATASGDPGKVLYTYGADRMEMVSTRFDIVENGGAPVTLDLNGVFTGMQGTVTLETGAQVIVEGTGVLASQAVEVTSGGEGASMVYGLEAGRADTAMRYVLPTGGMDVMNLAAAFERGLAFDVSSQMAGYATRQVVEGPQGLISDQRSTVDRYDFAIRLDRDGLAIDADTAGIDNAVTMPALLPLPIEIRAETGTGRFVLPISASESLQTFELSGAATGLEVNEPIWALIDPEATLPRDPATLRLGLTGKVKSFVDVFNFADFTARMDAGEVPGELHEINLTALEVDLAGARLTGTGAATFDNTDTASYGGFPKPVGSVDLMVQGVNGLMDRLVALGLLTDEDMMGARMMMGMIAKPDPAAGKDVLRSKIELTEEGHVLANGMRMK